MTGKCLCGDIEFTARAIPGMVFNCHCSRCRVSHGADYATQAFAVRNSLTFIKGDDKLREYESTGGIRAFCSNCGSRLMNYAKDGGDYLSIAVACLDESFQGKAVAHCFTDSRAPWHTPAAGIPAFKGLPDNLT
ncbi:MAG: GFA family protein [Exilibacterium sp.]